MRLISLCEGFLASDTGLDYRAPKDKGTSYIYIHHLGLAYEREAGLVTEPPKLEACGEVEA